MDKRNKEWMILVAGLAACFLSICFMIYEILKPG